jgi:hypothetical protein
MTAQPAKRRHGPVKWWTHGPLVRRCCAGARAHEAVSCFRGQPPRRRRGRKLVEVFLEVSVRRRKVLRCRLSSSGLFNVLDTYCVVPTLTQGKRRGMAQQVGFTRSKTKPLSPGFFPAEKERQFAESQQSESQQPAEKQGEMPPPPAQPKEPAAQPQERAAGQKLRAYSLDGPVEAVGLQADSEFWQVFEDIETLGRGHFAKVKLVSHLHTREDFAAKILDKTTADNDIEDLVREFQMLRSLRHPNIIRLFAAYETPRKLYLVTEVTEPSTT